MSLEYSNLDIIPKAGGGQSGATVLQWENCRVVRPISSGDSVALPTAADTGDVIKLINESNNDLAVFAYVPNPPAPGSGLIDGVAGGGSSYTLAAGKIVEFIAYQGGQMQGVDGGSYPIKWEVVPQN